MKMKKLVSAIAALAMSVSSFTAFAAEGDVTTNVTADFNDGTFGGAVMGQQWNPNSSISEDGWFVVGNSAGLTWNVADEELAGPTDVVTVKFKVAYGKLSGKDFWYSISDSKGTAIVDWNVRPYNGLINTNVLGSGTDLPTADDIYWSANEPIKDRAVDTTITIDFANGTVTQYTKCYKSGTGKAATEATHTNPLPTGVTDVKSLKIGSGYNNASRMCVVDDISITTTEGAAAETAAYTVNYVLGDKVVKSVDGEGVVGNAPLFEMNEFWSEDATTKYFCVSDDLGDKTIAADGSTVVTVTVRVADTYAGNIVASTGDVLASFSTVEGESTSYSFSKYLTDANGKVTAVSDGTNFTKTVTPTSNDDIVEAFTAYEGDAWFTEGKIGNTQQPVDGRLSGGFATRGLAADNTATVMTVAEDGMYSVTTRAVTNNSGKGNMLYVYKNSNDEANLIDTLDINSSTVNYINTSTKTDIALKAGDTIVIGVNSTSSCLDYLLIEKTGDYVAPASIDSAVEVVATYGESDDYEGTATALTATFTITGETAFNYVTFAVGTGSAEGAVTTVSGDGASAVYGIVVNAIVEAADVVATASMTE